MPTNPSLRQLALALGLSHTTVSEALRGCERVHPKTRERVVEAAKKAGYTYNPLAGALMSEMRRSRTGTFRGGLAILDVDGPGHRDEPGNRFHAALAQGATDRATELGFKADLFTMGKTTGISLPRIDKILQSRGIRGIFLLPVTASPELMGLDWSQYAGVYSDYTIEKPALHTICSNHYRSMLLVLERLHALGYKRPGLVLRQSHDQRLMYRWEAAFLAYHNHHGAWEDAPDLVVNKIEKESFLHWFTTSKPDVVLCHDTLVMEWMRLAGAEIPRTHGFCCLNTADNVGQSAGLNLQPELIGSRGIELLIAQLHRNEYGPPKIPSNTTIVAAWQDGPTLRKPTDIPKPKPKPRARPSATTEPTG
jgi:DNA-binding LacI/PurR family transcriptional regulator